MQCSKFTETSANRLNERSLRLTSCPGLSSLDLPFPPLCCFLPVADSSHSPDVTRPLLPPTLSRDREPNWWIGQLLALSRSQFDQVHAVHQLSSSGHPTSRTKTPTHPSSATQPPPAYHVTPAQRSNEHHPSSVWEQQATNIRYLSRLGFILKHKHDNQQFIQHT